ncbi:hypothetical protein DEI99_010970 [Curtobacterium sp. MCLR17_036]|uniref:hypothetical protein n=1 Tax=Curtobacterium sp. MCLR17_036 TaxID=2175620 RepID=UPI0011B57BCD|nr:hypothetical protein [Curtobacterium sp. MCLR17_036]WIE63772.1 hypothetical protein DEI99_010970 [Curtobacterium sp. MCLR17_036]
MITPNESAKRKQYGPPVVPSIAWGGGGAVVAFAAPVVVGALLAGVALLVGVRDGRVVLANGVFSVVESPAVSVLVVVAGAVLAVVGFGFGATASTAVMIAGADEESLGPRSAWRWTFGQRRLVVEAALAAAVSVAVGTVVVRSWQDGGRVVVAAVLVLLVVVAVLAAPLLLGWVLVVAGVPRGEAVRRGWSSGRVVVRGGLEATSSPRRALVGAASVALVLGIGVWLLVRLLPASAARASLTVAWSCVAVTVLVVFVVAVAARGAVVRGEESRLRAPVVADSGGARRPLRDGLTGVGVLLVPALVFAVLVTSNPFGLVQYSVATVDTGDLGGADVADVGDRTVVVSSPRARSSLYRSCQRARCGVGSGVSPSEVNSAIGPAGDGGLLTVQWHPRGERYTTERFELEVVHSHPDELEPPQKPQDNAWPRGRRAGPSGVEDETDADRPAGRRTSLATVQVVDRDQSNYHVSDSAIAAHGHRPVIAGIARSGEPDARAHLFVVFCQEPSCARHAVRHVALPWIPSYIGDQGLDLAVAPDGTAVVSLVSETVSSWPELPSLRVVSMHPDGAEPVVRDLPEAFPPAASARSYEAAPDARVAIGGDGNPVVLGRTHGVDAQRLTFCSDISCSSATHREIATVSSSDAPPAFVIDRSGRPLIATRDDERGAVGLVSCSDARCDDHQEATIARFVPPGPIWESSSALAIGLTADDVPMLVSSVMSDNRDEGSHGFVIRCDRARCGLQ